MSDSESRIMTSPERVARNVIRQHGKAALVSLIKGFHEGRTLDSLGKELGVTRERVRQWKLALVTETVTIQVPTEVVACLAEGS